MKFNSANMGKRIRKKREESGKTQEEMAALLHLGRSTYNQLENGKRPMKDEELLEIASLLGTSCDYILQGTETKNLDICDELGLSNQAVSILREWVQKIRSEKDPDTKEIYIEPDWSIYFKMLEFLISSQAGNNLLSVIYRYAVSDFFAVYFLNEQHAPSPATNGVFIKAEKENTYSHMTEKMIEAAFLDEQKEWLREFRRAWRADHE